MSNNISVLIQGLNEAEQLPRLFAPLKGIEDIVFIDHQSTDNSVDVAKSLGARVVTREFLHNIVTEDDVIDFKKRFGYDPAFKKGDKIIRACDERYEMQKNCKNDWILNLDCDEIITWDYKKVQRLLNHSDVVNCKFYHDRNPDGSRKDWFQTTKLYNRQKTWWIGRIHEVIDGYNLRVGWSEEMEIDHHQRFDRSRRSYISHLEYSVLRDNDIRAFYYLGKEYHLYGEYEKAINIFTLYLGGAFYLPEKIKSYIYIAYCMWELDREDEAWVYCMQALKLNPNSQEAYLFLATIASKKDRKTWLKHAELASNDHLL